MPNPVLISPPMMNGFPANATSSRTAAMATNAQSAHLLNKLNNKGGTRIRRGGQDKPIVVSMPQQLYPSVSSQNTGNITKSTVGAGNQALTNNAFYNNVQPAQPIPPSQLKGGSACGCDFKGGRKRKGGTRIIGPNQTWGCYSGGKRCKSKRARSKKRRSTRRVK